MTTLKNNERFEQLPEETENTPKEIPLKVEVDPSPRCILTIKKLISCSLCFGCCGQIIGLLIVIIVLFFPREISISNSRVAVDYVAGSLQADPILDLYYTDAKFACGPGYERISLGTWKGSNWGCYCDDMSVNEYGSLHCKVATCSTVFPKSESAYDIWKGSVFCAKRAKLNEEYWKGVDIPAKSFECSPGIYMKDDTYCPITHFALVPNGTNLILSYKRTIGDPPLISIQLTENETPCFSPHKTAKGLSEPYLLMKEKPEGCKRYGSDTLNTFWVDKQTQFSLFQQNSKWDPLNLPESADSLQATLSVLSGRTRIKVSNKENCQMINYKMLKQALTTATDLKISISVAIFIGAGLAIISTCMAFSDMFSLPSQLDDFYDELDRSYNSTQKGFTCFGISNLIFDIVFLCLIWSCVSKLSTSSAYFAQLEAQKCFLEGQPIKVMQDLQTLIYFIPHVYLTCAILMLTSALAVLFGLCLYARRPKVLRGY